MGQEHNINETLLRLGLGDKKYADTAITTNTLLPRGVAGPMIPGQAGFADAITHEFLQTMKDEGASPEKIYRLGEKSLWAGDPRLDKAGGYDYETGYRAAQDYMNFLVNSDDRSMEDILVHKKPPIMHPEPDPSINMETGEFGWRPQGNKTRDQVEK